MSSRGELSICSGYISGLGPVCIISLLNKHLTHIRVYYLYFATHFVSVKKEKAVKIFSCAGDAGACEYRVGNYIVVRRT